MLRYSASCVVPGIRAAYEPPRLCFPLPVRYEAVGEGEPVVLVHGLSGSRRWWAPLVPALAERYRVHLVDLPGFGGGPVARPRLRLGEAAAALADWLEQAELAGAHLVGHSMGGVVCLRAAAHRPELVERLVLIAPAGLPTGRSTLAHVVPLARALAGSDLVFLRLAVRDALHAGPVTIWRAARELLGEDVRADLCRVVSPTLLVWADRDPLVPPALAGVFRSEIERSRLLLLEGAGHVPMFDRPRELAGALSAFLAGEAVGE